MADEAPAKPPWASPLAPGVRPVPTESWAWVREAAAGPGMQEGRAVPGPTLGRVLVRRCCQGGCDPEFSDPRWPAGGSRLWTLGPWPVTMMGAGGDTVQLDLPPAGPSPLGKAQNKARGSPQPAHRAEARPGHARLRPLGVTLR